MTSYRYPLEQLILVLTISLLSIAAVVFAGPTLCLAPVFLIVVIALSYRMNQVQHQALLAQGAPVSSSNLPALDRIMNQIARRLRVGPVVFFVVPGRQVNAYTFGLSDPKVVVVFSSLLKAMDEDELRFVLGHELGHVALGHAWLNTLLGGMAGVPVTVGAAVVLTLAFRWWNRMCEYSCDRAGLLACGNVNKAISALIKLFSADADTPQEIEQALRVIEQEDDSPLNVLAEMLSTHPMLVRRIQKIKEYAASSEYRYLQSRVNQEV